MRRALTECGECYCSLKVLSRAGWRGFGLGLPCTFSLARAYACIFGLV